MMSSDVNRKLPGGNDLHCFLPLFPLEEQLLINCRTGNSSLLTSADYTKPLVRADNVIVRAEFLRFLLLGGDKDSPVCERGVELGGAWIEGKLNLESARLPTGFKMFGCIFSSPIDLTDAIVDGSVYLAVCEIPGIRADRVNVRGLFSLHSSVLNGTVVLNSGKIGGDLFFENARFQSSSGVALQGIGLNIGGDIDFKGVVVSGQVNISTAIISGALNAESANFINSKEFSINACRSKIGNGILFEKAKISGELIFMGVVVEGDVDFSTTELDVESGDALSMDRAFIGGNLWLCNGFSSSAPVRFPGSRIEKNVYFTESKFVGNEAYALNMENVSVGGDVRFDKNFHSSGTVSLAGLVVKGDLILYKARFESSGHTLRADGVIVVHKFSIREMVLPLSNASFAHSNFGRISDDKISWGDGIVLDGLVYKSFVGSAAIDAKTRLAWLEKQPPSHSGALKYGDFRPQPWRQLRRVLIESGHFEDACQIGIAYESRIRRAGLVGQVPPFRNGISGRLNKSAAVSAHWIFGILIGYGYRPARLIAWIVGVWLTCGALYWYAALNGVMAPSNPLVFQNEDYRQCAKDEDGGWYLCTMLPEEYTGFSPLSYSLDVLLPFVNLQQEDDWAPKVPTPKSGPVDEFSSIGLKHFTRLVMWCEIIFGWIAGVLLVAVVSGLAKRRDD